MIGAKHGKKVFGSRYGMAGGQNDTGAGKKGSMLGRTIGVDIMIIVGVGGQLLAFFDFFSGGVPACNVFFNGFRAPLKDLAGRRQSDTCHGASAFLTTVKLSGDKKLRDFGTIHGHATDVFPKVENDTGDSGRLRKGQLDLVCRIFI